MLGREIVDASRVTTFADEGGRVDQEVVLAARGLTRHQVIEAVDVTVHRGEVVGLAGLLGSGRSSTAKAIYGAQPLDAGTVSMEGREIARGSTRAAIAAGIALIPEDRKAEGVVPDLVRAGQHHADHPAATCRSAACSSAPMSGASRKSSSSGCASRPLDRTRSSPSCRAATSRRCSWRACSPSAPALLILDDPTRGIDVGAKAEIQALVSDLAGQGIGGHPHQLRPRGGRRGLGPPRRAARRRGHRRADRSGRQRGQGRGPAGRAPPPRIRWQRDRWGDGQRCRRSTRTTGSIDWQHWLQDYGVYLGVIALIVSMPPRTPTFLSYPSLRLQLIQVVPVAIVALGLALVIGTRGIDISLGSVMAVAAATMAAFLWMGPIPAIVVALIAGSVLGLVNGTLVAHVGIQPIVATLGMLVAGRGIALVIAEGRLTEIFDPFLGSLGSGSVPVPYVETIEPLPGSPRACRSCSSSRSSSPSSSPSSSAGRPSGATSWPPVATRPLPDSRACRSSARWWRSTSSLPSLAAIAGRHRRRPARGGGSSFLGNLIELSAISAVVVGGTPFSGGKVRILGTLAGRAASCSSSKPRSSATTCPTRWRGWSRRSSSSGRLHPARARGLMGDATLDAQGPSLPAEAPLPASPPPTGRAIRRDASRQDRRRPSSQAPRSSSSSS